MRLTEKALDNVALYYLQRYAATRASLKRVLLNRIRRAAKEQPEKAAALQACIDPLLERYERSGLLNDVAFAQMKTDSLRRRGGSARGIANKLAQKGVAKATIKATVVSDRGSELEAARELCRRKKLGSHRTRVDTDPQRARKDMAVLARAGFRYDVIVAALKDVATLDA